MIHRGYVRATKAEADRMTLIKNSIGCICCALLDLPLPERSFREVHHIVRGGKRLGHWWTLPLCTAHHRQKGTGIWTSIANGTKAFSGVHGSEMELWVKTQHILGLSDELPATKTLPRRVA